MWSLIPWRRVASLATPFFKEVFIGKFNLLGYFFTNKVISILFITLIVNYLAFQYVVLGYNVLYEQNLALSKQNKICLVKVGELESQLKASGVVTQPIEKNLRLLPKDHDSKDQGEDKLYKQALYEIIRLKQKELREEEFNPN